MKDKGNELKLVNIGYGNTVVLSHVVGIVAPYSVPMKRFLKYMKTERPDMIIDATFGNRLRSLIQTDCGYLYLSSIHPQTLAIRLCQTADNEQAGVEKLELEDAEETEKE